ncbi:MAG: phosphate ABC transporter substrate-binding protein PstS [Mycobacterium sp.]
MAAVSVLLALLTGCGTDGVGTSPTCMGKQSLTASGSTAQAIAMDRFVAAYEEVCPGRSVDYTANGSGAGISQFLRGETDFGASDSPIRLSDHEWENAKARCGGNEPWHLPLVFGPIAITYNVFGVASLILDGPTIAKIFTGRVTNWDAPEIATLNPDQHLPRQPIVVFFRSDESGTTDNFQKYLQSAAGAAWDRGAGKTFNGGVGRGRRGNEGTSAAIPRTPGSITYTEWSFAQRQQLPIARIITSAGSNPVSLTVDTAMRAIATIRINGDGNNLVLDTAALYQPTRVDAYPIVLATYEIVCPKYGDRETGIAIKAFLRAAINDGQRGLAGHGYIPLPEPLVRRLTIAVDAIT